MVLGRYSVFEYLDTLGDGTSNGIVGIVSGANKP